MTKRENSIRKSQILSNKLNSPQIDQVNTQIVQASILDQPKTMNII